MTVGCKCGHKLKFHPGRGACKKCDCSAYALSRKRLAAQQWGRRRNQRSRVREIPTAFETNRSRH